MRDGGRRHPYHLLSAADKESYAVSRLRPSPLRCPDCEVGLMPEDLLPHQDKRCPGLPAPRPGDRWMSVFQVSRLGISRPALRHWIDSGLVRTRLDGNAQTFLEQDIVREFVIRRKRPWLRPFQRRRLLDGSQLELDLEGRRRKR